MTEEIWKDIKGYEGTYQVSNLGNVMSLKYGGRNETKILKHFLNKYCGYKYVTLTKDKKHKIFTIHRLVAEAFIPNPDNLPVVNHKDEDKTNNCVENLEWCTQKYNVNYGSGIEKHRQKMIGANHHMYGKFGKEHHRSKPIIQFTKDGEFVKNWVCAYDVQRELKYNVSHINEVLKNKRKTAYGYIWRYKDKAA